MILEDTWVNVVVGIGTSLLPVTLFAEKVNVFPIVSLLKSTMKITFVAVEDASIVHDGVAFAPWAGGLVVVVFSLIVQSLKVVDNPVPVKVTLIFLPLSSPSFTIATVGSPVIEGATYKDKVKFKVNVLALEVILSVIVPVIAIVLLVSAVNSVLFLSTEDASSYSHSEVLLCSIDHVKVVLFPVSVNPFWPLKNSNIFVEPSLFGNEISTYFLLADDVVIVYDKSEPVILFASNILALEFCWSSPSVTWVKNFSLLIAVGAT